MRSPMLGTGTNIMGPLHKEVVKIEKVIQSIDSFCKMKGIHHAEVCNYSLKPEFMAKFGYTKNRPITNIIPLPQSKEQAYMNLASTCRNRIRKAKKNKLKVEIVYNTSIVDEFYSQFKEVYGK